MTHLALLAAVDLAHDEALEDLELALGGHGEVLVGAVGHSDLLLAGVDRPQLVVEQRVGLIGRPGGVLGLHIYGVLDEDLAIVVKGLEGEVLGVPVVDSDDLELGVDLGQAELLDSNDLAADGVQVGEHGGQ